MQSYKAIWKFLRLSESLYSISYPFPNSCLSDCTFVGSLYKPYNPNVSKDHRRRPWKQVKVFHSKVQGTYIGLYLGKWQKKSSLMDIGQSVQISAGSWIVHMARTESQVERPKKNYRSRAFSNLGRLMQDPVIMRDRLVLTLSFFPTGGALPTTLVSVTSLEYLSLAEFTRYWRISKAKGLWKCH